VVVVVVVGVPVQASSAKISDVPFSGSTQAGALGQVQPSRQ